MIYNGEDGLHAIMFSVSEVPVFAESEEGRYDRIPGKKALINRDTQRVLSIVSDRYHFLHNELALDLALEWCVTAFPTTAPAHWKVFSVEAPLTGGHCRIDLKYGKAIDGYDWSFSNDDQDKYGPFVRVTNSYNKTRTFGIQFGLVRWACTNGLISWHSSITIKVAHDVSEMQKSIKAAINESKFKKVLDEFHRVLDPVHEVRVLRHYFCPVIQSVLQLRKPANMPLHRENAWKDLMKYIDDVADRYVKEMGETGYALVNAISDIATNPPTRIGKHNFIRRERDSLQRLVGSWLAKFAEITQDPDSLESYLLDPTEARLQQTFSV